MSLIPLENVKTYMQITGTVSDAILQIYIDLIEGEISAVLDRELALATYTEVTDYKQSRFDKSAQTYFNASPDMPKLFLKNYPITTISSVVSGGNTVSATEYTYRSENGILEPDSVLDKPTVTYSAGYTTASFPAALQMVYLDGVSKLYYNNRVQNQSAGNVKSKKIKDFSVEYGNSQTGYISSSVGPQGMQLAKTYIASNMTVLNRYKRVEI